GYTIKGVRGVLSEEGPKFVQEVWRPGAPQPSVRPREEAPEEAEQLAPDDAARTLFGLLKAPSAPRAEDDAETATSEPTVSAAPAAAAAPLAIAQLSRENIRRLQSALHELRECRRLIDEALKDEAA